MGLASLRYGGGNFDIRSTFLRIWGFLQGKKVKILNSDPQKCAQILSSSDVKGTFIEHFLATPAWSPIYSVESVDGKLWEELARNCRKVMGELDWRKRLSPIIFRNVTLLKDKSRKDPDFVVCSETISRLVLQVMFELLFDSPLTSNDETLFYQASLEFRKQIGIKGSADPRVKERFWARLRHLVTDSRFGKKLQQDSDDPGLWLSIFAQPFLISPQINVSDIMEAVFRLLRTEPLRMAQAQKWASTGDSDRLYGIVMEAIRLQHPFPVLEREITKDIQVGEEWYQAGTQVFILLDRFVQDQNFNPERWTQTPSQNPYHSMPFGAGRRMCLGKPIAILLLVDLLKELLIHFSEDQLQPGKGHLFSGRSNDQTQSRGESVYQARTFGEALWRSFAMGREFKKHKSDGLKN